DADDAISGSEFIVNQTATGVNSGNQRFPTVSLDDSGMSLISFQGETNQVRGSVFGQLYTVDIAPAENVAPQLTDIGDQTGRVGQVLEIEVLATDRNRNDILTFRLDPDQSPAGATITKVDNRKATVRWTPTVADRGLRVPFRVLVDDSAVPPLGDAVNFTVDVQNAPPSVDTNGTDSGLNSTVALPVGQTQVSLADNRLTVTDADHTELASATASIKGVLDGTSESLVVVTTGTTIVASYDAPTGVLTMTGTDTLAHYQQVLRSLSYRNTATNPAGTQRRIEVVVNDGSSPSSIAEIVVTLQGTNSVPTLNAITTQTVLAGSPFYLPLDAEDVDNDALTYTVTSSNPQTVAATLTTGNRSLRLSVQNFGDMVFELYEDKASRATSQIIALAQEGFYNGIIFHRVVNGFVIQAGDPTGTGTSGSQRPDFDDQFHVDLQHNRSGILSMAKTTDDTNNSQFFVTEGPTRHLDFNHTIFGQLVEGEAVREAISNVAVNSSSKPLTDVRIQTAQVFTDTENRVLQLKAPEGMTGQVTITVQVSDGRGGIVNRDFTVNVVADNQDASANSPPFLEDIPTITTSRNATTTFQLQTKDVEGNPVFFLDEAALVARGLPVPVNANPNLLYSVNSTTGLLTVEPRNQLVGMHQVTVAVVSSLTGLNANSPIDYQVVDINILDPT
ncbi:MAG TPA: peptidylprolyl isomerase, partial [Pirellulaceae bacterium]